MANNLMAIVCKKCKVGMGLAKYYPLEGFIGGPDSEENSGWYVHRKDLQKDLEAFFIRHKHNYDRSTWSGHQYFIGYQDDGKNWKFENWHKPEEKTDK